MRRIILHCDEVLVTRVLKMLKENFPTVKTNYKDNDIGRPNDKMVLARRWLKKQLSEGKLPVQELQYRAEKAGMKWSLIYRASQMVGVAKTQKTKGMDATWRLLTEQERASL